MNEIVKHTEGPWTVHPDLKHPWHVQCETTIPSLKGDVCTVSYRPNAYLIAAAPELLAFVEAIAKTNPVFVKGDEKKRIAEARALVAKATASPDTSR